ncbi:type II toxin-antitoxin system RelE/ParE family toxin [Polaribacter vadi]|uniref:type II toxin-antitoxin system RelE/ParE family toxin n=1 Tax=Polaribacter vadi TaxID=1774273 RepID=UPI0030EE4C68|tara:strand:+ start:1676 stop:1966 length:291 start_codon:yes stop_codon:yes gene_type:complete
MQIIWDSKANIDLTENIKYIAKKSPQNALMVLDTLLELPNSLIKFPYSYPIEPFYNDENVRFITKWSFKMVYYIRGNTIYIMRIFNTNILPKRILE